MSARNLSKLSAMQNKTVRSYTAMTFPKEKKQAYLYHLFRPILHVRHI